MTVLRGKAVSGGTACGPALVLVPVAARTDTVAGTAPGTEQRRIEEAVERAKSPLEALRERAVQTCGAEAADILDVQCLMLEDPDYLMMIRTLACESGYSAEAAVRETCEHFVKTFAETGDEYLQARATDVKDVSNRLLACLGGEETEIAVTEPIVLVAEEIVPSALMRIGRQMILALVSRKGTATSHASILARSLGIPAVVNVSFEQGNVRSGQRLLVDGTNGRVVFDPDEAMAAALGGLSGQRKSSRTEFLYLGRSDLPDEDEQYQTYPHRVPPQGVMIETPAAALVADELAKSVDFFSIGTNDLTQYTLALDREGEGLEAYFKPHHPAVLQLIRLAADAAHRADIPVSICGELAADPGMVDRFLAWRIDSLSF